MNAYDPEVCQGEVSIQNEINQIIRHNAKDWPKKINDHKYREAVRQKLHEKTDEWCDYKANTCLCGVE